MKASKIKYLIVFFLIVITMLIVMLETQMTIGYYLLIFVIVSLTISILSLKYKYNEKDLNIIPIIIIVSFIFTYFLGVSVIMTETSTAYSKIKSIPKEKLVQYYKTEDVNIIPKEYRYAWIGVCYRKIKIIPENRIEKIKAVGWRTPAVFAYYNIEKDRYSGSYH